MTGEIYSIAIQGYHNSLPHPHVVVIEFDRECWVIPAFDADGAEIALRIADFQKAGYAPEHIYIELDNSRHVTWTSGKTGKVAKWVVARAIPMSKTELRRHKKEGQMDAKGLRRIATAMLQLADAHPSMYSANMRKRLRRLLNELAASGAE